MNKPITPKQMKKWIEDTWKRCQDEAWKRKKDR